MCSIARAKLRSDLRSDADPGTPGYFVTISFHGLYIGRVRKDIIPQYLQPRGLTIMVKTTRLAATPLLAGSIRHDNILVICLARYVY